jgi:hypothetical protein
MYELIANDLQFGNRQDKGDRTIVPPPVLTLSIESQIRMKALYEYVDACQTALDDIKTDFSLLEPNPECPASLRASERLQKFCIEADSWEFDSLCEISRALQLLVIESRGRVWGDDFWKALNGGLATLSALLEKCACEFRWRLAVADTLDRINQICWN